MADGKSHLAGREEVRQMFPEPGPGAVEAGLNGFGGAVEDGVRKSSGRDATAVRTATARSLISHCSLGGAAPSGRASFMALVSSPSASRETCGWRLRQRSRSRTRLVAMG